jgi:hypothetical protein
MSPALEVEFLPAADHRLDRALPITLVPMLADRARRAKTMTERYGPEADERPLDLCCG